MYNLNEDFNERFDLAKKYLQKLEELIALFEVQAKQYNIYPYIIWDDVLKNRIRAQPQPSKKEAEKLAVTKSTLVKALFQA